MESLRAVVAEKQAQDLGRLSCVPRYQQLGALIHNASERSCYILIHETVNKLGRAMQLRQHRRLIDSLNLQLGPETLTTMTSIAMKSPEARAAFAVYLTTLEQAYHWPRDAPVTTPRMLENHKLVIQVLNQPRLREMLDNLLESIISIEQRPRRPDQIAQLALSLAESILDEVRLYHESGETIPRKTQNIVNLLYRTCQNDWNNQGDYNDAGSHKEFGHLHEVVRAPGTQRRMHELFEESQGLLCFQAMPSLLAELPHTTDLVIDALTQLQFAVAIAREELASVSVDETIWGLAFANLSKAVGFSNLSAGGGDAPIFWMLDSLCGQTHPEHHDKLIEELEFRSQFFPSNMRELINRMQDFPRLRSYCASSKAPNALRQSFKALERQRFELYEMHRKKAARISVSLRAGQRGTSAGVSGCAYATPEKKLAKTLSNAMTARFGEDGDTFSIEATAQAHSLMFDEHQQIYSARVRFELATPLAVGPGDCLLVSVQLPDGVLQTRTYSITYTYSSHRPLGSSSHQLANAVEVYVRSKGLVSSYLCHQIDSCQVRVAMKPAPHFRLLSNSLPEEEIVFIAQGGATGVFVAWLEAQPQHEGRYLLIVAIRQFSQLGFKDELLRVASKLRHCVRIVVVLSKPQKHDCSILEAAGIETFCGRINEYLESHPIDGIRATYICGASSFAFDAVRAASPAQLDREYSNRLEPIVTSHLPSIHVHVAPQAQVKRKLPVISLEELAQHNSPTDIWIAVGSNVYDITALSKFHPGGEKILFARAGRQADDLFDSVHGDSVEVRSLLQDMIVGRLAPSKTKHADWENRLDKVVEMQNDLTNHSRFEKIPGLSTHALSETPPTQVIYATLECFVKDWCSLLQELNLSGTKQCQLMRASISLMKTLDATQAEMYSSSLDDEDRCRQVLTMVFDKLRETAGDIHAVIDALKTVIAGSISSDHRLDPTILETYTDYFITAIKSQMYNM